MKKKVANKRKRSKKNTSDRSGHSNSLNKVVRPLTAETNRNMKIIICRFLVLSTFAVYLWGLIF